MNNTEFKLEKAKVLASLLIVPADITFRLAIIRRVLDLIGEEQMYKSELLKVDKK